MKKIITIPFLSGLAVIFICSGCRKEHVITEADFPKVRTLNVSGISTTSAACGGNVYHQGISLVTARGLCFDTIPNPTLSAHIAMSGRGGGEFYGYMSGLLQNSTYYVRAFATNEAGTAYGEEKTFRTLWDSGYATVSTKNVAVSFSWMEIGGNVTDTGGSLVTEYGVIWGTSPLPATGSIKVACGSGTGQFSTVIHGLMMNVPYYVRAYAINTRGTSYGEQQLIRTINYPFLTVPGSFQGWNPADTSTIIASVNLDGMYEGYVWFPAYTEFKYADGSWSHVWGDNNHDGHLQLNGANISVTPAGFYKLNVDFTGLTHAMIRTEWGIVGTATPGGWSLDTDLSYGTAARVWTVTMNLLAGELKFRANHSWDLNYGDDNDDGLLEQDGNSIFVGAAGKYTIVLDFRKPVYRYTLKQI